MKQTLERESSKKSVKNTAHQALPKTPLEPKEPAYPHLDPNVLPDDYVPFNANSKKLDYPLPEGYQGYWQLDQPGMIESMKKAYWSHLTNEKGEPVTMPNKNGGTLFLMITPNAYYKEAMRRQQEEHDRRLDGIAAVDEKDGQYSPMGMPKKNTALKYS